MKIYVGVFFAQITPSVKVTRVTVARDELAIKRSAAMRPHGHATVKHEICINVFKVLMKMYPYRTDSVWCVSSLHEDIHIYIYTYTTAEQTHANSVCVDQ